LSAPGGNEMPNAVVVFTPAAALDLDDIWFDIALDNPAAADRMIDAIKQRSEQLSAFPQSGPLRPDIADDARSLTIGNYLMLYRLAADSVEVIRIVHGARDVATLI
jgi:toxin ParE1/3/4